jgi:hypothetical protein
MFHFLCSYVDLVNTEHEVCLICSRLATKVLGIVVWFQDHFLALFVVMILKL